MKIPMTSKSAPHKEHNETPAMESRMHSKKFLAAALRKEIAGSPKGQMKDKVSKDV